jgi:IclR family KDG regulon transcriptional repressor
MDVLDLFGRVHEELTLTEISRRLDVPKSSAHALLQTMRRRGYLAWNPTTKGFSIGLRVVALSQAAPVMRTLQQRARPHMEALAETVHETVMLGAFEADSVVCIETVESPDPVRFTVQIGERRPLHCTSLGKLYLAGLEDEDVRRLFSHGLSRETAATVTDVDELIAELRVVRRQGYARNRGESIEGLYSLGVPIPSLPAVPIAGLSVVGVASRIEAKEAEALRQLRRTAASIAEDVGAGIDMSAWKPDPSESGKG